MWKLYPDLLTTIIVMLILISIEFVIHGIVQSLSKYMYHTAYCFLQSQDFGQALMLLFKINFNLFISFTHPWFSPIETCVGSKLKEILKKKLIILKRKPSFFYIYSVVGNGPYKRTATAPGVSTNVDMSSSGTFSHCFFSFLCLVY